MSIVLLVTLILGALAAPEGDPGQGLSSPSAVPCIPMQSLTALTFTPGQIAIRRRTAPVLTMQCQGDCPPQAQVLAVQCTNTGTNDLGSVQWKCEANISPQTFQLASVHVQCEGCTRPGDTDVTQGSCQLQYSLMRGSMNYFFFWIGIVFLSLGLLVLCILLNFCCPSAPSTSHNHITTTTYTHRNYGTHTKSHWGGGGGKSISFGGSSSI